MNHRLMTAGLGLLITLLGIAGLVAPDRVMAFLGFTILNASKAAAVLGEIRATYGGLFTVMGLYTLQAAFNPGVHRSRLTFIGLLWLGAAAGRLVGVWLDGSPGLFGWLTLAFEVAVGGGLTAVALSATPPPVAEAPAGETPAPVTAESAS
jgi:hypothetical protein